MGPPVRSHRGRWRRWIGFGSIVTAGLLFSSCSQSGLAAYSGSGSCFEELPIARAAVSSEYSFVGVKSIDGKIASRVLGQQLPSDQRYFCLVAYHLLPGRSSSAPSSLTKFMMVVVSPKTKAVVGVKTATTLPFGFRRNLSVG